MINFKHILKESSLQEMTEGYVDVDVLHRGMPFEYILPVLKARSIYQKGEHARFVSLTMDPDQTLNFGNCAIGWSYEKLDQRNELIVVEYDDWFFEENPEISSYVMGQPLHEMESTETYGETIDEYLSDWGLGKLAGECEDFLQQQEYEEYEQWPTKFITNIVSEFDRFFDTTRQQYESWSPKNNEELEEILLDNDIEYDQEDMENIRDFFFIKLFTQDGNLDWLISNEFYDPIAKELYAPFEFLDSTIQAAHQYAIGYVCKTFEDEKEVISKGGLKFKYEDICYILVTNEEKRQEIVEAFPFLEPWIHMRSEMTISDREEEPEEFPPDPIKNYHDRQTHFPFFKRGAEEDD